MTDSADPIARLGEIVGPMGALTLAARWGGTRLFVPREPRDDHPIATWIGAGAMARLCRVYGGDTIEVPGLPINRARRERIRELREQGATASEIATVCACSLRYVRRVLAEARGSCATATEST